MGVLVDFHAVGAGHTAVGMYTSPPTKTITKWFYTVCISARVLRYSGLDLRRELVSAARK